MNQLRATIQVPVMIGVQHKIKRDMKRYIIYGILASGIALTGCSDALQENKVEDHALQLLSVSLANEQDTRAIVTSSDINKVNVYVANTDGSEYVTDGITSLVFAKGSTGGWSSKLDEQVEIKADNTAKVYASYPSDVTINNDGNSPYINVTVLEQGDNFLDSQTDYLYATPKEATSTERAITLEMNHALAKVSFCIQKAKEVTEEVELQEIKIHSGGNLLQAGVGTMQLSGGKINGLSSVSDIVLKGTLTVNNQQTLPNVSCLVAPMNSSDAALSFVLSVKVGDNNSLQTFSTSSITPEVKWMAGKHYMYTITIKKVGGTLDNVQIVDWKNDASQNTNIGI